MQFGKHIFAQPLLFDELPQSLEEIKLEIRHLLLRQTNVLSSRLVSRADYEQQFHHLHFVPIAGGAPRRTASASA